MSSKLSSNPIFPPPSLPMFQVPKYLSTKIEGRYPRVAIGLALATTATPFVKKMYGKAKEHRTYTITVDGNDDIYNDIHAWLLELLPDKKRRSLIAFSSNSEKSSSSGELPETVGSSSDPGGSSQRLASKARIRFRFDGTRTQTVYIEKHKVKVSVTEPDLKEGQGRIYTIKEPIITFTAPSVQARDAIHTHLSNLLKEHNSQLRQPRFKLAKMWGSWEILSEIQPRSLESVVLPQSQLEGIVGDMNTFFQSEHEYGKRCIPWHRGYLFEGPPGTGKTSVAKALANHFGMDIWYMPLGDMKEDADLLGMISCIRSNSLLLLEDIDVFQAATERRNKTNDVSLSGLLNALDGISTPHGLVTILTTNDMSALDPALVRPGRVDRIETFTLAKRDQIGGLFKWFYECEFIGDLPSGCFAPADILNIMHRHKDEPKVAADLIREMGSASGLVVQH